MPAALAAIIPFLTAGSAAFGIGEGIKNIVDPTKPPSVAATTASLPTATSPTPTGVTPAQLQTSGSNITSNTGGGLSPGALQALLQQIDPGSSQQAVNNIYGTPG